MSGGTDGVNGNWRDEIPTEEGKKMMEKQSRLFIDPADGLLKLRYNGGRRTGQKPFGVRESNRVVVPLCWRKQILRLVHDGPLAGHMGVDRTWSSQQIKGLVLVAADKRRPADLHQGMRSLRCQQAQ